MMKLKPFNKVKECEIEWLEKIPNDWVVKRVKDLGRYQSGFYINANDFVEEGYPIFGGNGFRGYSPEYNHDGEYVLIGRQGALCGNINYASGKFWATEHAVVVYKNKKLDLVWLGEILRVMNLNQYALAAAQPGLSVEVIKRLKLPFPSESEQKSISSYIQKRTEIIDQKISLLQKKITHYEALKKSLINETVCRGLDKKMKMKDSEVEWIGEIPEHWNKKRMKDIGYLYSGLSGKSGDDFKKEDDDRNRPFIKFTNISNDIYVNVNDFGNVIIKAGENQNRVNKHDIFFLMSSEGYEDIGKSALLTEDFKEVYLNSFCKGFRITEKEIFPQFINFLLLSDNFRRRLIIEGKGFTRINLKMEKINNFHLVIPPLEEQQKIAKFLGERIKFFNRIKANIENQIEYLKELRKTLINDIVTGKLKVPASYE